ncbi:MAG: hypothetical protein A2X45_25320 [Lentisphaerae bacterium GWF2_50_93]|nr:MAG: hypothetical protein A2X45_25320 [Lentisphaerae bacterium GWF2_50_93]
MYSLLKELFPICRSITGDGVRESLGIIGRRIPLRVTEVPSGTRCFDWTVPDEWNISSASITDSKGRKTVDFADNNLHVVNYSEPFSGTLEREELMPHLHSIPSQPDVIPYVTTYYKRRWGFCLRHKDLLKLKKGKYKVEIKSSLKPGSLTFADAVIPGRTKKEIVISSYLCHPSLANDSISGVVVATHLYKYLKARKDNYYSYRFIFVPETIGAIAYLKMHKEHFLKNVYAGLVLTCLGDSGPFNYKKTRQGDHSLDRICANVLKHSGHPYSLREFWLPGSDERQYSSPGFNIPVGSLMRSVYGEFKEYHTSDDDLNFVKEKHLEETLQMYKSVIDAVESDFHYINLNPFCELHLSKYGLGSNPFKQEDPNRYFRKILTLLNFSDGKHSLCEIADKLDVPVLELAEFAKTLEQKKLMRRS